MRCEPESQGVIDGHAAHFRDLASLRAGFIGSGEFRQTIKMPVANTSAPGVKSLEWPAQPVQVDVPPEQLQRMIQRIEAEFAYLGEHEPHWSVLTADRFKAANIAQHEAEFFASGETAIKHLRVTAERTGIDLSRYKSCFELGCGLGRITIWLAKLFEQVTGGDISGTRLAQARQTVERAGLKNVSFAHLNQFANYANLPAFDVFFSFIVLQHNPPPLMAHILELILTRLAPGGIAYFQIPTYQLGYRFSATEYLESKPPVADVEVHCVPQPDLFAILARTGCDVLEMREDDALGAPTISNRLFVRKRR